MDNRQPNKTIQGIFMGYNRIDKKKPNGTNNKMLPRSFTIRLEYVKSCLKMRKGFRFINPLLTPIPISECGRIVI